MSGAVEELRPLTAGRLLAIRREAAERTEDELERAMLCNAQVLAESCFSSGGQVFSGGGDVLENLTCREMETLLGLLAAGKDPAPAATVNPRFDAGRFARLRREQG